MFQHYNYQQFTIYTDPAKTDVSAIHNYLSKESYWAENVPFETVKKSVEHSICFNVYEADKQIGFARVITDKATFAYLCDVYILPEFRGKGLSKWLMKCVTEHPDLSNIRRFMLATKDAHGLYAQFGFEPIPEPARLMGKLNRNIYKNS